MKVLFLHGWQSVPGGVTPTFLARHGHEVVNPKLPDDFAEAVRIAQAEFDQHQPQVVVGSSRGAAVWSRGEWPGGLERALERTAGCEPSVDVRERMRKALRGEPLSP